MYITGKEKMSKREEKRLIKYINKKKEQCGCIVLSKSLKNNLEIIENTQIPIAEGRWLFKFLVIQILEYISRCQETKIDNLRIALITNNNDNLITYYIEELCRKTKKLKIVTSHREKFHDLEERLYYNDGIVLEISNNRRKALQEVDIIFNFGIEESKINKYRINEKAIIINLKEKVQIKSKRFAGININYYQIDFENRLIESLEWTKEFEKEDLYESYIYRRGNTCDIVRDIVKDNVVIKSLIGNKGEISKKEYKNVLDKSYDLA